MASVNLDRVLEQLLAPDSASLRRGAEVLSVGLLDQPLAALIDLPRSASLVLAALSSGAPELVLEEHATPGWFRQLERADAAGELVDAFLPEETWLKLEQHLQHLQFPRGTWLKGLVEPNLLKELLAPVIQDTLTNFAKRMPGVSLGGGLAAAGGSALGGLAGRLKKQVGDSAKGIADVGRSVVGGLEGRLQKTIADFSRTAQDEFRAALLDRLASPDGRRILGAMRSHALKQAREVNVAEVMRDLEGSRALLAELAPEALAHNARREEVTHAVLLEVEALLEAEGDRPVRELLDELGQLEPVREALAARVAEIARRLLSRQDVLQFLAELSDG